MCTGGEHTGSFRSRSRSLFLSLSLLPSHPVPSRIHEAITIFLSFLPSTPFFLFALKTSERTHGASRTYFSVHTIIVERAYRWYQVQACSSAPRKGALFFHPPILSILLYPSPRPRPRRPGDLRLAHSFFIRWTNFLLLFPGMAK